VKSLLGGSALLLLAAVMLLGFLQSSATLGAATTWLALLITVGVPGGAGVYLLTRHFGAGRLRESRRDQLRRQTLEAEVLRLAGGHSGRLALVDVVTEMALSSEDAQAALDGLVSREIADIAVTDSGTLVYTFRDVERAAEKSRARNILE
jgi:hypothetical protein